MLVWDGKRYTSSGFRFTRTRMIGVGKRIHASYGGSVVMYWGSLKAFGITEQDFAEVFLSGEQ